MKNITKQMKQQLEVKQFANNCFIVTTNLGDMLVHYDSNIAFIPRDENMIYLGKDYKYSTTTSKLRNRFLNTDSKELEQMIKEDKAKIVNL